MKKNRLSFSAVSIDTSKSEDNKHRDFRPAHRTASGVPGDANQSKKMKSSTFQYSKFGKKGRGGPRKFGNAPMRRTDSVNVPPPTPGVIRIIPLGGVEEIGKNMTAIEIGDDIIVVDAGMHFSTEETPGVDYVIPNTTYLEERKDRIRAMFVTHGHLDHIGGIPLVLSRIGNPPVYSRNLSILMMRKRQAEFPQLPAMKENIVEKTDTITCGKIKVRFFGVTHTIPDSLGIIIETDHGWIVTPGDYKLDQVDGIVSKEEEKEYSIFDNAKVLLLLTDSTNIENEGYSLPEIKVHQGLENLIRKINGRIIIAAFASHITRLAYVVKAAEALGRKIVLDGRSMKTNIDVAIEAGYFEPKKGTIIPIEEADNYPPHKVVILMTGAQGEEFASLNRAANKSHTKFQLHKGDTIILSSSIIPGNERAIERMKDGLARQGVKIIGYRTPGEDYVHATGHGNQEDVKWLHRKTHPRFFIPIHGNHYRLVLHKELAMDLGMPEQNIIVPDNGSIIEISPDGEKMYLRKEKAPSGLMMVDGVSVGDSTDVVIKDRQMLAQDGMFVIIAVVDQKTGKLKKSPDLISRGFVYLKENQELLRQVRILIKKNIEDITTRNPGADLDYIKASVGENISKFLYQKTSKRPLVIPVVLNI
ncbi:MAG: ribonuclease J [Candidatus Pacebacteria bacterium]|nr:ribonuclease J [Candidatus Paceibacterota bacterium]MBP9851481.1 ribonuclease J [Candidatus Paceibacterota bacterium]